MKILALATAIALSLCISTIIDGRPQSLSLNFHFIPALVSSPCTFGSVWSPTNGTMRCAMCLCLNGRISRCVPQPGCNPNNITTSTPATNSSSSPVVPVVPLPDPNNTTMTEPVVPPVVQPPNPADPAPVPPPGQVPPPGPGVSPAPQNASSPTPPKPGRFRKVKLGKTMEKY